MIRIDDVRVEYGSRTVLNGITLDAAAGEFLTLVGQTGCGKSTLLRLILGSEAPTSGRIQVGGQEVRTPGPDRGYVPQKYSLFPDKTVLNNITFGPEMSEFSLAGRFTPRFHRRRKRLREQAHELMRQMSLHETDAGKYPEQLSGGMQQRVAIAQALMMRPRVLLMDEAFSALDPATRAAMQKLIREVWATTGTTIVFVTHNLAEAIYLGSRVVVLARSESYEGAKIALDLAVPDEIRHANGYPRRDEMNRMIALIEDGALGGKLELEMAEFGG